MNDDTAPCDRPPLVATTTQVAYRWENPEPGTDVVLSIKLEVTEGLAISQDRSAITGSALSAATLRVMVAYDDGVPRPVLIPLHPATATALRDVADAYDALHHLHVELAQRRGSGSLLVVEDEEPTIRDAARPAGCVCSYNCGSCDRHGTPHLHDSARGLCLLHPDSHLPRSSAEGKAAGPDAG